MTEQPNTLGDFLRARRDLVSPEQVGVVEAGRRRVPGLRREEVALLAGISAEYYLRLERGRDLHPSVGVLESLARVLQLDEEHLNHLLSLAAEKPRHRGRKVRAEIVPDGTRAMLSTLPYPAFVEGRYFDVLAANPMASALSPRLSVGGNQLLDVFLDPAEQSLHRDWDGTLRCYVSSLRHAIGPDTDDRRFIELVGRLSLASTRFRDLWTRHDVSSQRGGPALFDHPQVGLITLHRERLAISGTDGMTLVIYHADRASVDAEKLTLLASSSLAPAEGNGSDRRASVRRSSADLNG
ncbi:helix-turn-helix domain-containing protein [Herbiconiux sp. UC225_62]|uniref:helix-turn-helix domain-containing protein n=1 Tax=Herbiconiux sp. UC225_62 TaxID=3350168 RepID=UPI0036D3D6C6